MKSETDIISELAKAISISTAKPESEQADIIFVVKKRKRTYMKRHVP
jgi:hypothetical protein